MRAALHWLRTGLLAALCAAGASAEALVWSEADPGAGSTLATAQTVPSGPGFEPVEAVQGRLASSVPVNGRPLFEVDLYQIVVSDGPSFSAVTRSTNPFDDTALFLFDSSGRGVYANDDHQTDLLSTLAGGQLVDGGIYYLGVALGGYQALDAQGRSLFENGVAVALQSGCPGRSPIHSVESTTMNKRSSLGAALACVALCGGGTSVSAHPVGRFADDMHDAPGLVYFTGVLYRPGMKITRVGACNDGGYPDGAFTVFWNDNGDAFPGLGVHFLDGGAVLQDFCGKPWQVEFDTPVKSFSASCYDPPGGYWPSTDVCRVKAFDVNGAQIGEAHVKRSPTEPNASVMTVKTADGASTIYRAELSYQTNLPYNRDYPFPAFMNWGMLTWETGLE